MIKPPSDIIKAMHASEVLDFVLDAWLTYKQKRTAETLANYNWWVDVYNFKRGKQVLTNHKLQQAEVRLKFEDYYGQSLRA